MRIILRVPMWLTMVAGVLLASACQPPASESASDSSAASEEAEVDVASYGIGYQVANQIRARYGAEVDGSAFSAGVDDGLAGVDSRFSDDESTAALEVLREKMQSAVQAKAEQNLDVSRQFLAKNAEREGVVTLPSGLQYEVLAEGEGESPGPTDRVTTHYHGTLIDGTVFDSSVERGEPIAFNVNGVIRGWTEALQLMKPGAKWKLFIPSDLAYGAPGRPPKIAPNSALIFDVELIEVN